MFTTLAVSASAGQRPMRIPHPFVILGLCTVLISSVTCAPAAHDHKLGLHHVPHSAALAARNSTRHGGKHNSKSNNDVMSPSNKLFPLVVVVIIVGCLAVLIALVLIARCALRRKAGQDEPEAAVPEKRATLRHAASHDSNATLYAEEFEKGAPLGTPVAPVMSSVARGSLGRFGSMNSASSRSLFERDIAPDVPDKCNLTQDAREKVLQSRASVRSNESGTTLYSLYAQIEKEEAQGVRENDLAKPCLTHASRGWQLQPSELEGIEDVSLDGPPRPSHAL